MLVSRSRYYNYISNTEIESTVKGGKTLGTHCVVPASWAFKKVRAFIDFHDHTDFYILYVKQSGSHNYVRVPRMYVSMKMRIKLLPEVKAPLIPEIVTDYFAELE